MNTQVIKERLLRGAYAGAGAFAAGLVEGQIESNLPVGDLGTAAGQAALGLGMSVGVDMVFDNPQAMPNDAIEYAGYGMQAAGFANIARGVQTGAYGGSDTVHVSATRQSGQQATTSAGGPSASNTESQEFSVDMA
jgi:hypothetical protein